MQVNRWLSVRLELLGVAVVCGTALVVTVFPTNPGLAGLALTSALNLTGEPRTVLGRLVHFRDLGTLFACLNPVWTRFKPGNHCLQFPAMPVRLQAKRFHVQMNNLTHANGLPSATRPCMIHVNTGREYHEQSLAYNRDT